MESVVEVLNLPPFQYLLDELQNVRHQGPKGFYFFTKYFALPYFLMVDYLFVVRKINWWVKNTQKTSIYRPCVAMAVLETELFLTVLVSEELPTESFIRCHGSTI